MATQGIIQVGKEKREIGKEKEQSDAVKYRKLEERS